MARPHRSCALLPASAAPDCIVCDDLRWVHLRGVSVDRSCDIPCPVCNRHPNLPPVEITAEIPRGAA